MKPTHYHQTFTFSAVSIIEDEYGKLWTSDGYKASSVLLKPLSELVGLKVTKSGCVGEVVEFLSDKRDFVQGNYSPISQRYLLKKRLEFLNSQVGVFWHTIDIKKGMPYYWNDYSTLTFI